jgi:alpha-L-fucosidase
MKPSRKEGNGTEWYLKRLSETSTYRPIAGFKETKEFHANNYPDKNYFDFASDFTASEWDCDEWMELCKRAGASYAIITTKHHDGYCLWPTKTTERNSVASGPQRNLIEEFKASAAKYGLDFGVYYSWMEFDVSMTKKYVDEIITPQIIQLLTYEPQVWWFDGHWTIKTKYAVSKITELCERVKRSGAVINDRIPGLDKDAPPQTLGLANYRVFADRFIPSENLTVSWESIHTIGRSWGIMKQNNVYKTGEQLLQLYRDVTDRGGKLLPNFGPDETGKLDPREVASVNDFIQLRSKKKYRQC